MQHPILSAAEAKYMRSLTDLCSRLFLNSAIPSHDHIHHSRVWENASVLLDRMFKTGMVKDPLLAEKAIIAAYFHDTGLTQNQGTNHGRESRHICSGFLITTDLSEEDKEEILDAVEKHDDKEYHAVSIPTSLAVVISVADDIDAFGQTGIERYSEIYKMRGTSPKELPEKVIANATARFNHLAETYYMFPDIIEEQKARVEILITYFKNQKT